MDSHSTTFFHFFAFYLRRADRTFNHLTSYMSIRPVSPSSRSTTRSNDSRFRQDGGDVFRYFFVSLREFWFFFWYEFWWNGVVPLLSNFLVERFRRPSRVDLVVLWRCLRTG